jgi:DNA-binding IclR family transcriptional regulator
VTPGTAALGVAFPVAPGSRPIAALSVAAISSRLTGERLAEVAHEVQQQVRQISALLAAQVSRPAGTGM